MIGEMTKVISVRIPMTAYMGFIKKATQNKLTVSEYLFTKLFSDEDIERDKNEIIELKAALIESNEKMASVVTERDTLNTSWIECCEKIVKIENERDALNEELRVSNEKIFIELNLQEENLLAMFNREHSSSQENINRLLEANHLLTNEINSLTHQQNVTAGIVRDKIKDLEQKLDIALEKNKYLMTIQKEDIKKKPRKKIENIGIETN